MNDDLPILSCPRRDAFAALDAPVERSWRFRAGDYAWLPLGGAAIAVLTVWLMIPWAFAMPALCTAEVMDCDHAESDSYWRLNHVGRHALADVQTLGHIQLDGIAHDEFVDGWGQPLLFEVPGPGDSPFEITSLGRDGVLGTRDDIRFSEL